MKFQLQNIVILFSILLSFILVGCVQKQTKTTSSHKYMTIDNHTINKEELIAAKRDRRAAANLFIKATKENEQTKKLEFLIMSRDLLKGIEENYPNSGLVGKAKGNREKVEQEIKLLSLDINTLEKLVKNNKQERITFPQKNEIKTAYVDYNAATNLQSSKGWAVVVGISEYKHNTPNGINNLIFADEDAITFSNTLQNLGWNRNHIKLLTNKDATQRNIMIALESWLSKAGPGDLIVLFWAGHGYPDPENPEQVYFACYDTEINIPATGYRMDRVRSVLEERKSKNVILLADTCHAGKLITRGKLDRGISIIPNIKRQKIPKGWIFMVGADTDRQAIEHSSWSNGAFTHSLIEGLRGKADGFQSAGNKDRVVTLGELKAYMNTAMPDETQRVLGVAKRPVITTSTGDPDIWNLSLQMSD